MSRPPWTIFHFNRTSIFFFSPGSDYQDEKPLQWSASLDRLYKRCLFHNHSKTLLKTYLVLYSSKAQYSETGKSMFSRCVPPNCCAFTQLGRRAAVRYSDFFMALRVKYARSQCSAECKTRRKTVNGDATFSNKSFGDPTCSLRNEMRQTWLFPLGLSTIRIVQCCCSRTLPVAMVVDTVLTLLVRWLLPVL